MCRLSQQLSLYPRGTHTVALQLVWVVLSVSAHVLHVCSFRFVPLVYLDSGFSSCAHLIPLNRPPCWNRHSYTPTCPHPSSHQMPLLTVCLGAANFYFLLCFSRTCGGYFSPCFLKSKYEEFVCAPQDYCSCWKLGSEMPDKAAWIYWQTCFSSTHRS